MTHKAAHYFYVQIPPTESKYVVCGRVKKTMMMIYYNIAT